MALVSLVGAIAPMSASGGDLRLLHPMDSGKAIDLGSPRLSLEFDQSVAARALRSKLSVFDASGKPVAWDLVRENDHRFRVQFSQATPGPYQVRLKAGVRSVLGDTLAQEQLWTVKPRRVEAAVPLIRPKLLGVDTNHTPGFEAQLAGWATALRIDFVREGHGMSGINPTCMPASAYKRWNWGSFDAQMDAYERAGIGVLLIALQFNAPACARADPAQQASIFKSPEMYADFVEGLTRHVADRGGKPVIGLELGNEPDVDHFWITSDDRYALRPGSALAYYHYLRAASDRARRVRAQMGLRLVVMNGGYSGSSDAWWRDLLRQPGMSSLIDALSIHAYPFAGDASALNLWDVRPQVAAMWRGVRAAGLAEKPVWLTEYGIQTDPACPWSVDENAHGKLLARGLSELAAMTEPQLAAVSWFSLQDRARPQEPRNFWPTQNCFGAYGMGLVRTSGRPRPAFREVAGLVVNSP